MRREELNLLAGNTAPSLHAARASLERQQIEDALGNKLGRRPSTEDLLSHNIMKRMRLRSFNELIAFAYHFI